MKKLSVIAVVAAGLLCTTGFAQTLPKTHLKVVGGLSNLAPQNVALTSADYLRLSR